MQTLRRLSPPVTAQSLASEMNVSLRTIYRDIDSLRGLGAVIDGEAGFGFTLVEDTALPPLGFEDDELEALVLGLRDVATRPWHERRIRRCRKFKAVCRRGRRTGCSTPFWMRNGIIGRSHR